MGVGVHGRRIRGRAWARGIRGMIIVIMAMTTTMTTITAMIITINRKWKSFWGRIGVSSVIFLFICKIAASYYLEKISHIVYRCLLLEQLNLVLTQE